MATAIVLLISCFGPVLAFVGLIALIQWIQDRIAIDPLADHQKNITKMYTGGQYGPLGIFNNSKRPERESKSTPHYDAFVDAEWKAAKRLEAAPQEDDESVHSLGDMLQKKDKQ